MSYYIEGEEGLYKQITPADRWRLFDAAHCALMCIQIEPSFGTEINARAEQMVRELEAMIVLLHKREQT